jgi:hypothetical protein
MTGLVALFLVGSAAVVLGLYVLLGMLQRREEGWEFPETDLMELVELRALNFPNFSCLFSNSDYRLLRAEPRLIRVAQRLRTERKRLALQWITSVRSDVFSLWRLRRLLTSYGVSEGVMVELATTVKVMFILTSISLLRLCVFLFGPFVFQGIASRSQGQVESYKRSCRLALGRLPMNKWSQFKAEWQAQRVSAVSLN